MRYINLPGTDMKVAQIQLGTGDYGIDPSMGVEVKDYSAVRGVTVEAAFRQMDEYLDLGGNFIDTAIVYNDWIPGERSRSEKTVGKWLAARGTRDKVYIATKGGISWEGHTGFHAPPINLSAEMLNKQIPQSMEHLGIDYIDLYWLHRDERTRPVGEIMETLNENIKKGYVRYIGASNWLPDRIAEANAYAREHGLQPFIASQIEWSLARMFCPETPLDDLPFMDEATYQFHKDTKLTCFAYSSQGRGFYSKLDQLGEDKLPDQQRDYYLNDRNRAAFKRIKKLSAETGYSVTDIALSFINSQYAFTGIPVVACRTHEQFVDTMKGADVHLTPEQVDFLLKED